MLQIRNTIRLIFRQRTFGHSSQVCLPHANTSSHFTNYIQRKQNSSSPNDLQEKNTTANLYKDVYKDIGYKSPFTNDEKLLILKTLNEAKSEQELYYVTAKPKAAIIFEHIQKHGLFNHVEELLSVKKFDEKVLERLGKKIIKLGDQNNDDSDFESKFLSSEDKKHTKIKLKYSKLSKKIKPKIKVAHYLSNDIQSIVAIKLSFYNFSYVHMDKNPKVILNWDSFDCFESKESTQHPKFYENIVRIITQIPEADLYVIEEQLPMLNNRIDSYFTSKVNLLELQSALISLLNIRKYQGASLHRSEQDEDNNETLKNCVHLMNASVIDDIFGLKVGTERIGIQNKLFYGENPLFGGENPHRSFEGLNFQEGNQQIIDAFHNSDIYSKYAKEQLATTLMMVAGLHDIMSSSSLTT